MNEEFAKQFGEFTTSRRSAATHSRKHGIRAQARPPSDEAKDKLVAELVKRNEFEVPEVADRTADRSPPGTRTARAGRARHEAEKTEENGFPPPARRSTRAGDAGSEGFFAARKSGRERENCKSATRKSNREVDSLAKQTKQTAEAVRARLTRDGGLDRIRT